MTSGGMAASVSQRRLARLRAVGLWGVSAGVTGFYLFSLARSVADVHSAAPLTAPSDAAPTPATPARRW